jgi:hypothetical protein
MLPTIGHSTSMMKIKHIIPLGDNYNHAPHMMCRCEVVIGKNNRGITVIHHRPMDNTWDVLKLIYKTGVVLGEPSRSYHLEMFNHV